MQLSAFVPQLVVYQANHKQLQTPTRVVNFATIGTDDITTKIQIYLQTFFATYISIYKSECVTKTELKMRALSDNIVQYTRYPNGFICFQERKYIDEAQFLACGGIQGCINAAKNLMTTKRSYVKALVYLDAAIHQVGLPVEK